MKAKWTRSRQEILLPVGVHLASIASINFGRNAKGELVMQQDYPIIEITFISSGIKFTERISTHPNSQWIWDNLARALSIDNHKSSISAAEAKGKLLYIIIAAELEIDADGTIKTNDDGSLYYQKKMRMEFFPYYEGGTTPAFAGHPDKNNGIPSGKFLINKNVTVKTTAKVNTADDDF